MITELRGYAHPRYAQSLEEHGEPRELPHSGGWVLVRRIPDTPYKDAMGCYPLFSCRDWTKLRDDLDHVGSDLVSLALVADPFCVSGPDMLEQLFDYVRPFKTHYVTDLGHPLESFIDRSYRYNARSSLKVMDVEVSCQPAQYLDEWIRLYNNLIRRHHIRGISAFSPKCFELQLNIPGMVMVLGRREGEIVGATLVLIHEQVAYSHLTAFCEEGYKIRASYGIYWKTLLYLQEQGIRYFEHGGTAGIKEDPKDGLTNFKKGWSNERRMAYFCGRVFDRGKYESICRMKQIAGLEYFPAYRAAEIVHG